MTDTLSALLTELRERFAPGADVREVEVYLASRGYDARQIGEILAEFATHLGGGEHAEAARSTTPRHDGPTFRVLAAHERTRFASDAWGQLLALTAAGTLTPFEREQLIDRALQHTDGRIGLAELRALLDSAGFDDGPAAATIH